MRRAFRPTNIGSLFYTYRLPIAPELNYMWIPETWTVNNCSLWEDLCLFLEEFIFFRTNYTVDLDVLLGLLVPSRYLASICSKLMPCAYFEHLATKSIILSKHGQEKFWVWAKSSLTLVSGIAKKAVIRVRVQKPEYMKKAPPSPKIEYFTHAWKGINVY